jgi:uncharacterized tellurite resistance protein B-like protein
MDRPFDLAHHRCVDPQDRLLYVQILAQMLIADGRLADEERSYLDRIMDSLGMPEADRRDALASVSIDSPVEERVRALSDSAKATLLAEVEKALHVDGELSRSEAYFLDRVKSLVG